MKLLPVLPYLSLFLSLSLVIADPSPGSFQVNGVPKKSKRFQLPNGAVDLKLLQQEASAVISKYAKTSKKSSSSPLSPRSIPRVHKKTKMSKIAKRCTNTTITTTATKTTTATATKTATVTVTASASSTPTSVNGTGTVALQNYWTDGVHDNTHIGYVGSVSIGTPPQVLPVDFDTGEQVRGVSFRFVNSFGSGSSLRISQGLELYGTTLVEQAMLSAWVINDTVTLGGFTVPQYTFGGVASAGAPWIGKPYTGVMGLGRSAISQTNSTTFIEQLVNAKRLKSNLFALSLQGSAVSGSQLTVGAVDSTKYTGPIVYSPVISSAYWEVTWNSFTIAPHALTIEYALGATFDTAISVIYVPVYIAQVIYELVPQSSVSTAVGNSTATYYQVPCNVSFPDIYFNFAGNTVDWVLTADNLNIGYNPDDPTLCIGAVVGAAITDFSTGNPMAIFGDAFLQNVYSVFSYDEYSGAPGVGFALVA